MLKALDKVLQGQGQSVFISGEAGVGMSRLIAELLRRAEEKGVLVLKGRCISREGSDPYLPFKDALKDHIGRMAGKPEAEGEAGSEAKDEGPGGILPMGLMGIGDGYSGAAEAKASVGISDVKRKEAKRRRTETDFTKERERLFSTMVSALSDLTAERPVALVLEDLHWADTATLQLLTYVIRNSDNQRLLIIGAFRKAEVDGRKGHPLKEVVRRARRGGRFTDIRLGPLDRKGVEAMVVSMLEVKDVPAAFTDMIVKETGGNPFFIEEVLIALVKEGVIPEKDPDLGAIDVGKVKVPSSVSDLVNRKVDALDDDQRKVLEHASVMGTEFTPGLLGKVLEMDEMALIDLLEGLMGAGVVEEFTEKGEIGYRFINKQFREVVYDHLSSARRRLLHKKVGHSIEALPRRERDKHLFILAHHLSMAREVEKALEYTTMAAGRAEESFAAEDAIMYYEKVLELLGRLPPAPDIPHRKKVVVAKIANLKFMTESWSEAEQYLSALEKVAVAEKDDVTLAEVCRKKGHIARTRGRWDEAERLYGTALEVSERISDELGIAEALQGLGHIHARKADFDVARAYLEKALDISKALDDSVTLGRTHIELGHVYTDMGLYEEALGSYTEGLMLLEGGGDLFTTTRGLLSIGDLCIRTKDWDKAIEFYTKAKDMADRSRDVQMRAWALFKLGESHAYKGSFDEAEDLCGKALMDILRTDDRIGLAYVYSSYGVVFRLKGDFGKAFVQLQQAMNTANDLDMPAVQANVNLELGLIYKDKGDPATAARFFEKSKRLYEKVDARALSEQAARLLEGLERYSAPQQNAGVQHFIDKSIKAMQRRSERRDKKGGPGGGGARNGRRHNAGGK